MRGKGRHLVHPQHSGRCISGQFDSPELCQVEIPYPGSRYVFHGSCSFINVEATVLLPRLVTGVQLTDHLHRLGQRGRGGDGRREEGSTTLHSCMHIKTHNYFRACSMRIKTNLYSGIFSQCPG